jgi:hypothetical protein
MKHQNGAQDIAKRCAEPSWSATKILKNNDLLKLASYLQCFRRRMHRGSSGASGLKVDASLGEVQASSSRISLVRTVTKDGYSA